MDSEREDISTPTGDEEEGGPVKSFLEHLEDLRWVLIKTFATLAVSFIVCLVAGDVVVAVLTHPLKKATIKIPTGTQVLSFQYGTNRLGLTRVPLKSEEGLSFGTNRFVTLQLVPVTVGTNQVLGLRPVPSAETTQALAIPLVSLSPAGAFFVAVQVAAYASVVITSPFVIFFIAQFVFPALKLKEKKYVLRGLFYGVGLFFSGVAFCYFILMPIALTASVAYTEWLGFSVPQWRAEDYIGFVSKFMLGMGLGFEMPVVLLVLVKIGVLNYRMLSNARRYVIVINFILGAVLTTPEVITQVMMAIPLQVLYEITIWIAWYWERKERRLAAARKD
jgi:sec-independent protein translocase protein TatC